MTTYFFDLTIAQAEAFIALYRHKFCERGELSEYENLQVLFVFVFKLKIHPLFTTYFIYSDQKRELASFEVELSKLINKTLPDGAFVRFSPRSPKDATEYTAKDAEKYIQKRACTFHDPL